MAAFPPGWFERYYGKFSRPDFEAAEDGQMNDKREFRNEPLPPIEISDEIFKIDPNTRGPWSRSPKPTAWQKLWLWFGQFPFRISLWQLRRGLRRGKSSK